MVTWEKDEKQLLEFDDKNGLSDLKAGRMIGLLLPSDLFSTTEARGGAGVSDDRGAQYEVKKGLIEFILRSS